MARAVLSALAAFALIAPAEGAAAQTPVPSVRGYTLSNRQDLSPGLTYVQYRSSNPRRVINVAFLRRNASEHFRMVLSNERVAGPLPRTETVGSMCRRVSCKIAVNGDFFSNATGQPAGGVAWDGFPIRTPPDARHHFFEDWAGNVGVRKIAMPSRMYATYPNGKKPFYIHSVNTARAASRAVAYTPKWGSTTEQSGGFELVLKVTNPPLKMDKTVTATITRAASGGNVSVPGDGLVISGINGPATELQGLWNEIRAGRVPANVELTFDSQPDLRMYTGGTPALLINGAQAFTNDGSSFMTTSDPKTLVGRNSAGDAILAVVDGRQSSWSVGMTMTQAMQFMRSLGAVEALNLDGGGSSTFVKNGTVINRPSDGRERPVAIALTIVA